MRVAIVHELLTRRGGAERVAKIFSEMFPEAPIYTLLYDEEKLGEWFPRDCVRTASYPTPYSLLPTPYRHNHHLYLRHFPAAIESWDFSEFDLVLSSSSAFAHGIITNGKPKHVSYIHSPARYLWDSTHDVLERVGRGMLGPLKRGYLERTFHTLRIWDAEVAPRPDALIANSREVQRRIELYWRRESTVIHPPIDDVWLAATPKKVTMEHPQYFLVVSTLTPYKQIDLAIHACNALKLHLKIVGEGPARAALERIAGPTIEFYGYRSNDELRDLYGNAQALIFPTNDDFGLVPVEAMACGTPVIARRKGGATETVVEGVTGTFFDEPTPESLQNILQKFDRKNYAKERLRNHAKLFTRKTFEEKIHASMEKMMSFL